MNPFKAFYNMIKSDIKTIVTTVTRMSKNEPVLNPEKVALLKSELKGITLASYFKENWIWILTILFAATMAWYMAAMYYSIQANNFILLNCRPEESGVINNTIDFSKIVFNRSP